MSPARRMPVWRTASRSSMTILIFLTDLLMMAEALLTFVGHQILCYTMGAGAYEWIRGEQPNLVILDWRMETPDTGTAVLGLLKKESATRSIPIIVLSAYLRRGSWRLCSRRNFRLRCCPSPQG